MTAPVDRTETRPASGRTRLLNRLSLPFFALVLVAKCVVLAGRTAGVSRPDVLVLTTIALVVALLGWSMYLRLWSRLVVLVVADLVVTGVIVADMVFFRYYGSVIPLPALAQSGQVSGVGASVRALMSPWDALYAVDVLVLVALLIVARRSRPGAPGWNDRGWSGRVTVAVTCVAVALVATQIVRVEAQAPGSVQGRYGNKALVRATGPLGYHAVDLAASALGSRNAGVSVEKVALEQHLRERDAGSRLAGVARGRNVIIVQMEAMQGFVVGRRAGNQEVTPTLNRLARGEAMYFDDYYSQISQGNTSDAEFSSLTSLYPLAASSAFATRAGAGQTALPEVLRANSYRAAEAFHAYKPEFWNRASMYPDLGFQRFVSRADYTTDETIGLGLTDRSFYRQTLPRLAALPKPFMAQLVTLSGHHPYDLPARYRPLDLPADRFGPVFGGYLQSQAYADRQLGFFLAGLKRSGLLDDSVVVVYGDHWGTGWTESDVNAFTGAASSGDRLSQLELRRVPMLIRLPGGEHGGVRHGAAGMVDLYPTLLNLLGIPRDRVVTLGNDMLNTTRRHVGFRYYEPQGTFVTDDLAFAASPDGRFDAGECFDRTTRRKVDTGRCRTGYDEVLGTLDLSDRLMSGNSLARVNAELARTAGSPNGR